MKIRWHYPAYIDSNLDGAGAEFGDQAELLALPRIRELMGYRDIFERWEISSSYSSGDLLLLIDKKGKHWVIGHLPDNHGLDFPKWEPAPTGITFRLVQNEHRDATIVEIYSDGQFRATLTPGTNAVHLISTHLEREPVVDRGGDIPSYQFRFRRD